jgi:hypothetical protein
MTSLDKKEIIPNSPDSGNCLAFASDLTSTV